MEKTQFKIFTWILFLLSTIILIIIMLNFLIAIGIFIKFLIFLIIFLYSFNFKIINNIILVSGTYVNFY